MNYFLSSRKAKNPQNVFLGWLHKELVKELCWILWNS